MLSRRVEASLSPVVDRWAKQDIRPLWPLFSTIPTDQTVWDLNPRGANTETSREYRGALNDSLATLDSAGHLIELFGITRKQTLHRIDFGDNTVFACCALVAHTVPAIFGTTATITSTDPISGGQIQVRISEHLELMEVSPRHTCGALVDCLPNDVLENPRSSFCCHVKHFESAATGSVFCSQDARRYSIEIEDFHDAAHELFRRIWVANRG